MERLRDILGKRIRIFREEKSMSQEQLAKTAGLGDKYVGMLERAEKSASFDTIERIAMALGVECYELFVPMSRRTDLVARRVKELLTDEDDQCISDFLRAHLVALKKLDRQKTIRTSVLH